jgi:hypothetical protein
VGDCQSCVMIKEPAPLPLLSNIICSQSCPVRLSAERLRCDLPSVFTLHEQCSGFYSELFHHRRTTSSAVGPFLCSKSPNLIVARGVGEAALLPRQRSHVVRPFFPLRYESLSSRIQYPGVRQVDIDSYDGECPHRLFAHSWQYIEVVPHPV